MRKSLLGLLITASFFLCTPSFAGQPLFSITPLSNNFSGPFIRTGESLTVPYQVVNNTRFTRTLTIQPINGVTQNTTPTTPNVCSSPFTLAPGGSCTLNLNVTSAVSSSVTVCKIKSGNTPDPFFCSQTAPANQLQLTNWNFAYILNNGLTGSYEGSVVKCQVAANGSFSSCVTLTDPLLDHPQKMAIDLNGTPRVYITNADTGGDITPPPGTLGSVVSCVIKSDGTFQPCVALTPPGNEFNNPIGVTTNSSGTYVYVVDTDASKLNSCPVSNGVVTGSCTASDALPFPYDNALNPNGSILYIANVGSNKTDVCPVVSNVVTSCSPDSNSQSGAYRITLNRAGTVAYTGDNTKIYICQMNANGSFGSCNAGQTALSITNNLCNQPANTHLNQANNTLYLACINLSINAVYSCPIQANNTLGNCTAQTVGQSLHYPLDVFL